MLGRGAPFQPGVLGCHADTGAPTNLWPKVQAGAVSRLGLHRQAGPRSRPDGRAWRALMTSATGYLPLCVSASRSCPDVCRVGLPGSVWPGRPVEPSVCQASLCSRGKEVAWDGGSSSATLVAAGGANEVLLPFQNRPGSWKAPPRAGGRCARVSAGLFQVRAEMGAALWLRAVSYSSFQSSYLPEPQSVVFFFEVNLRTLVMSGTWILSA